MSIFDAHENFAYALVTVAPAPALSGTALTVDSAALFPAVPFNATVWPDDVCAFDSNAEIVRVTNIVGNVFTFDRAQEGSSAKPIAAGYQIAAGTTVKTIVDIEDGLTSAEGTVATLVVDVAAIQADAVFDGDAAGGVLSGSYPNPGFAVNMATQAELDALAAAAVLDGDAAGGVLDGTYPNPGLAASVAGAGLAETADVLSVNVDASTIEINADALRVKDGGVTPAKLSFDPATQAELDAVAAGKISISEFNSKGDLLVGTGNDAFSALTVGADGKIAIADANSAGGLIYGNPVGQAGYATGAFVFPQFGGSSGSAGGFVLNSLYGLPLWIGRRQTFSGIGLRCGAGTATLVVRLGIWTGSFGPTTLVLDAGTVDGASALADKIIVTTFTLDPGLYWVCGSAQVAGTIGASFVALRSGGGLSVVPMLNRTDVMSSMSRAYVKTGVTGGFANITPVATEFNSSQEGYLIALRPA